MVDLSPDGRTVMTAGADYAVRFWDPLTGPKVATPLTHSDRVRTASFRLVPMAGEFSPVVTTARSEFGIWREPETRQPARKDIPIWFTESHSTPTRGAS